MQLRITTKAQRDIEDIARYTQRNIYLDQLDKILHLISTYPHQGKRCNYIRKNYFKYHVNSHIIFYESVSQQVKVIRVLHKKMDVYKHIN